MGSLAGYLQREFERLVPDGWTVQSEVQLLSRAYASLLGYAPKADVLLEHTRSRRRLWIELEVSRADPVANHAKFATGHLFEPLPETDAFVTMVSPHVARGRRNLAASTIFLMRRVGLRAFQTSLLPRIEADEIKRLNHLPLDQISEKGLCVVDELERAFAVSEPISSSGDAVIHYVGELFEVSLNVREWNAAVTTPEGRALWGRRTVTYFVFDPRTRLFAPSKFCAYSVLGHLPIIGPSPCSPMTMATYTSLPDNTKLFDGTKAREHLTRRLAMHSVGSEDDRLSIVFEKWIAKHEGEVSVHPSGPVILRPPRWY